MKCKIFLMALISNAMLTSVVVQANSKPHRVCDTSDGLYRVIIMAADENSFIRSGYYEGVVLDLKNNLTLIGNFSVQSKYDTCARYVDLKTDGKEFNMTVQGNISSILIALPEGKTVTDQVTRCHTLPY